MTFLARVFREPLVHFLLIGAVVFVLYALADGGREEEPRERIVVTEGRVQQLAQIFAKTWQRPATPQELRGLIDAYIKEEVYYREAVKLGLDRDDTLIRRRMQQKMEFLSEPAEEDMAADDETLRTFLDANRASYRVEPQVAFEQVFVSTRSGTEPAKRRADALLADLKAGKSPADPGDTTLLPAFKPLSPSGVIAQDFGDGFAKALDKLPINTWSGPVRSPYGLHLVRIGERQESYDPELSEIREEVLRDWRTQQRKTYETQGYETLLEKYEIVLPVAEDPSATAEAVR